MSESVYPKEHHDPGTKHLWQSIVHNVDVFREAIENAAQGRRVESAHFPAENVLQHRHVHVKGGVHGPNRKTQRRNEEGNGYVLRRRANTQTGSTTHRRRQTGKGGGGE